VEAYKKPTSPEEIRAALRTLKLPPKVAVREWTEPDFPAIQQLSQAEGWSTPAEHPHAALAAWHHSWPTLVAVEADTVIGFLRAITDGTLTTYVAEVLVAPHWRGQGIGLALLDACQRLLPGTRLDLLATTHSAAFYERHGFRPFSGFRRSSYEQG
jgi:predicted N-acetyltransferase YhbS